MHPALLWTVAGCGLALAATGLTLSLLARTADRLLLAATGVTEAATLVQSAAAGIALAGGHPLHSTATFVGYLIGIAVVLPVALVWAWADRTRWSGAVVAVGGLTVAVLTARLAMMWDGRA